MIERIREFGEIIAGAHYTLRPGGYAVILRAGDEIAIVQTPRGFFLPGGGQNPNESAEEAAVRESYEECGLQIRLGEPIGIVDQLVFAADEGIYFRKRCTFFLAALKTDEYGRSETDHLLSWLTAKQALTRLAHESQRWAVLKLMKLE